MASSGHRGDVMVYESVLYGPVGRLTFLKPLPIVVEVSGGQWVVADDVFLRYGAGGSQDDAVNAYLSDLIAYYTVVERSAAQFPEDLRVLQIMRDMFVFRAEPWQTD